MLPSAPHTPLQRSPCLVSSDLERLHEPVWGRAGASAAVPGGGGRQEAEEEAAQQERGALERCWEGLRGGGASPSPPLGAFWEGRPSPRAASCSPRAARLSPGGLTDLGGPRLSISIAPQLGRVLLLWRGLCSSRSRGGARGVPRGGWGDVGLLSCGWSCVPVPSVFSPPQSPLPTPPRSVSSASAAACAPP